MQSSAPGRTKCQRQTPCWRGKYSSVRFSKGLAQEVRGTVFNGDGQRVMIQVIQSDEDIQIIGRHYKGTKLYCGYMSITLLLICFIFSAFSAYSQTEATTVDGKKVILYPDRTWKTLEEVNKTHKKSYGDKPMNILKINNGKVEIRKDNGALVRTIGNGDAIAADFNRDQTLVVITTVKGKVEIRKENGALVRSIGNGDATSAKWYGDEIAITTTKGKTELRKENGALIRTF